MVYKIYLNKKLWVYSNHYIRSIGTVCEMHRGMCRMKPGGVHTVRYAAQGLKE